MDYKKLKSEAQAIQDELIELRRSLHQHAEVGFNLEWTIAFVRRKLIEYGYMPQQCGGGLVAVLNGKNPGKVFLLRADMDALLMKEESDVEYSCATGNMHACGHDMHTAMLLGAAKLLKSYENKIDGTVKLMFQPSEETLEGAKRMIAEGVLENPKVDAAMMIHVVSVLEMEPGTAILSIPGVGAPAAAMFEIKIQGKGCHGSMPETGIDPLITSAHILLGIEEIRARELASKENAMLTFGMMNGGTACNIIPDSVSIQGSMRAFNDDAFIHMKNRMKEVAEAIGTAYRCQVEVIMKGECPTLINDKQLTESLKSCFEMMLDGKVIQASQMNGSSGSEDFSCISHEVPSIMVSMAAGNPKDGYVYPQHHPKVKFDETVLWQGAALFASSALSYLHQKDA